MALAEAASPYVDEEARRRAAEEARRRHRLIQAARAAAAARVYRQRGDDLEHARSAAIARSEFEHAERRRSAALQAAVASPEQRLNFTRTYLAARAAAERPDSGLLDELRGAVEIGRGNAWLRENMTRVQALNPDQRAQVLTEVYTGGSDLPSAGPVLEALATADDPVTRSAVSTLGPTFGKVGEAAFSEEAQPAWNVAKRVAEDVKRAGEQIAQTAADMPAGLIYAAKPGVLDSAEAVAFATTAGTRGDLSFERSREEYPKIAEATARSVWEDITNPEERLGYLLMDLLAVGSLGAGAAVRTGSAGRAGLAAARARARVPEGDLRRPSIGDIGRSTQQGWVHGNPPRTAPLVIRQPMELDEDGQIIHPGGELVVDKVLPRSVLARKLVSEPRVARLQRRLDEGPREPIVPMEGTPAVMRLLAAVRNRGMEAWESQFGAQAIVGRELRAARRIQEAQERAPIGTLRGLIGSELTTAPRTLLEGESLTSLLPNKIRRGLTRGQQVLAAMVAREGDVVLDDPHSAIARWEGYYQRQAIENVGDPKFVEGAERTLADLSIARAAADEFVSGKGTERLTEALRVAQMLSARRRQRYVDRNLITPESAAFREAGPSAVLRGEEIFEETPVVRTSTDVPRARQIAKDRERIQKEIALLERRFAKSGERLRPRTPEEAQARLEQLNAEYDSWVEKIIDAQMSGPERRSEQARRNIANRRRFTKQGMRRGSGVRDEGTFQFERELRRQESGGGAGPQPTIRSELRKRAEQMIDTAIAARPESLKSQEMKALIEERRALEVGLGRYQERGSVFEGLDEPAEGAPQAVKNAAAKAEVEGTDTKRIVTPASRPKGMSTQEMAVYFGTEKMPRDPSIGARLSQMRDYLEKRDSELARALGARLEVKTIADETVRRRKDLGDPPPGTFYYYEGGRGERRERPMEDTGRFVTPQPGPTGYSPPSPARRDPGLGNEWEAELLQQGRARLDALSSVVAAADAEVRVLSALDMYDKGWSVSHPTRETKFDVPIRETSRTPGVLKTFLDRLDRNLPIRQGEIEQLLRSADPEKPGILDSIAQHLHPEQYMDADVGADLRHAGIRWIDRRLLADLGGVDVGVGRKLVKAADMINNPARLLYVYGRVAYILNLPGNLGMQVMTQGWLMPSMYRRAWNVDKTYGRDTAAMMESFVGEGKARATYVPSGFMARPTQALANFWSSFIDRPSRLSSLLYEMRRHGVDLDDPKAVERFLSRSSSGRTSAVRRANKNMVDFTNLTPFERNTLRHFIFLYPWVSRATVWAGRTVVEHPGKTWVLGELAQQAYDHREDEIGPMPAYLEDRGYFPVKVMGKDAALLVNPQSVNTFATAAENARLLSALMIQPIEKRTARAAVSPAVDALVGSLTGVTELGREYEAGGFVGAAKELVEATPIYQAARRAGVVDEPKGEIPLHQQRVFQGSSVGEVVGPFMLGGLYPRQSRLDVARERRRQENLQGMTPARRAVAKIDYEIDEMREQLVGSGLYDQESFNAEVAEPVRLWKMREARYAREAEEQGIPVNRLSSLDRTKLDLRMLVQLGYYDAESLELELANLDLLTETELKSYRRSLGDDYFGASTISALRTAIRELTGA